MPPARQPKTALNRQRQEAVSDCPEVPVGGNVTELPPTPFQGNFRRADHLSRTHATVLVRSLKKRTVGHRGPKRSHFTQRPAITGEESAARADRALFALRICLFSLSAALSSGSSFGAKHG